MDISKICIDATPETIDPEIRDSLPPMNVNNDRHHPYQLQYQLQHQYLKSYGARDHCRQQEPPSLSDPAHQRNATSSYPTKSMSASSNSPRPLSPQLTASCTSFPSSYQQYQSKSTSSSSSPLPHLAPLPPSNYTSPIQPDNTTAFENTKNLMKHIIDQCTFIYQRIGKYRTDPLRESERNQIIDHVFFTAEDMLKSLNTLNDRIDDNEPLTSSPSIGSSAVNNDNSRQMEFTNEDDSTPLSGNDSTMEEYKMIRQARNLQKNATPKYRRRSRTSMVGHRCHSCHTTDTPEWRRGPDGARTLCNACGLHYSKLLRKGSLTVQTHNYIIEPPPDGARPQTRAIQFPIIQVNNTNTNTGKNATIRSSARILEIDEDEENFATNGVHI